MGNIGMLDPVHGRQTDAGGHGQVSEHTRAEQGRTENNRAERVEQVRTDESAQHAETAPPARSMGEGGGGIAENVFATRQATTQRRKLKISLI